MTLPTDTTTHLQPYAWIKSNNLMLCKIISEFAHESIIEPIFQKKEEGWDHYLLSPENNPSIQYRFRAKILSLNNWLIDKPSLKKEIAGNSAPLDSLYFFLEFKEVLNIDKKLLPGYLEEITSTLHGNMYMQSKKNLSAKELAHADYQTFEHAMTSGHPSFIANNGRIGFDTNDYIKYTPEADKPLKLLWLAGHKSHTSYNAIEELPYEKHLQQELGEDTVRKFRKVLIDQGLSPGEYYFIPVHPWQWHNKIAILFSPDIALKKLIYLGEADDKYLVQQSLRTYYNTSNPEKHYVKTALSILNMGFVRGMGPYFMHTTPAITNWLKNTLGKDPYLKDLGFTMLFEVASIGYRNFYFEDFGRGSDHNKLLSGLWRESPHTVVTNNQQLMTMAALLHVDFEGNALLPALIKASGLKTDTWLKHYLQGYLTPLLHCFYAYDLTFMPHGENLILVLEEHVPVKFIMKDITEEVCVFEGHETVPQDAQRICATAPDDIRILNILVDIFDGYFRFLTQILVEHCHFSDDDFWNLVADCIHKYQHDNPQFQDKYERFNLFMPEFKRSCLNRLQLKNNKKMVDTAAPSGIFDLQYVGTLKNPLADKALVQHSTLEV